MHLGHVHLKVRDTVRAVAFYTRFLGLRITERVGDHFVFLSGDDKHHTVALQAVGPEAPGPTRGGVGLYHTAFEVAGETALAQAFVALTDAGIPVQGIDHGISWALYFSDPDGNGLEIYCDRRAHAEGTAQWEGRSRALVPAQLRRLAASAEDER